MQNLPQATVEAVPQVAQPGRGRQGQHADLLPPGQSAFPLAGVLQASLFWVTFVIKRFVFGMSGVQEKCLLAGVSLHFLW